MLQEHEFIGHKDTGEALTCQLWNMVYFELSMFLRYHQFFIISEKQSGSAKTPEKGL